VQVFNNSKVHSTTDWYTVFATEISWQAQLEHIRKEKEGNRTPTKLSFGDIVKFYSTTNAHAVIELHLPGFVPFFFFEKVLIPKEVVQAYPSLLAIADTLTLRDDTSLLSIIKELKESDIIKEEVEMFSKATGNAQGYYFVLENLQGNDIFLPGILASTSAIFVKFKAKGQHIRITFTSTRQNTRNQNIKVYNIVLGAVKNTVSFLKTKNISGHKVHVQKNFEEHPSAMASPNDFTAFWLVINHGHIKVGRGSQLDQSVVMEWTDPKPLTNIKFVGISGWESGIEFQEFQYGNL